MAATEFTPEITQDFYNTLSKRISDRGVTQAGQARSEALSRGLGGDPYEASAVGLARQGTASELNNLDSGLAFNVAGLNREERLTNEDRKFTTSERQSQDAWQGQQNDNERELRLAMAREGIQGNSNLQSNEIGLKTRQAQQGALWQYGGNMLNKGLGALAGGF